MVPEPVKPDQTERTRASPAGPLLCLAGLVLVIGVGMYSVPAGVITLALVLAVAGVLQIEVGDRPRRGTKGGGP